MKSKLNILILTMIALGFALTFGAPRSWAQGVDNPAVFELDGNTQDNPAGGALDWESTFPPGTPLTANPIQDPAPLTIYTTGGSKDINNVSQWRHKSGSVPDKDNILQAMAAALALPNGDTAVYFAASRSANNGDADIGLWFFQQNVAPQPDGTFGPTNHIDGDLLLLVNFEGGGLVPSIQAYKWQGGPNGGPVLAVNLTTGECGAPPSAGNYNACAITNPTSTPAPASWGYVPKSGTPGVFPPQSFFEGGVNLTRIFPTGVPCFSRFLVHHGHVEGFRRGLVRPVRNHGDEELQLCRGDQWRDGTSVHLQRHGHEHRRRDRLRCAGGGYPRECYRYADSGKSDSGRCQHCPRGLRALVSHICDHRPLVHGPGIGTGCICTGWSPDRYGYDYCALRRHRELLHHHHQGLRPRHDAGGYRRQRGGSGGRQRAGDQQRPIQVDRYYPGAQ